MENFDILKLISDRERQDFSQNFAIERPGTVVDSLFPDQKTENLEAEYMRLADNAHLPEIASVHAWDTEALIGSRKNVEMATLEMLLIKEKINQGERLERYLSRGVSSNAALRYVYDDMAREAEKVKTRTMVAKAEVLWNGQMTITENNLNIPVDYGVPTAHRITFNWGGASDTFHPWQDMQRASRLLQKKGRKPNAAMMSQKEYDILATHPDTQVMIYGQNGSGMMVDDSQIARVANNLLGFSQFIINEDLYTARKANGDLETHRYFPENRISFFTINNGAVGVGLWGVTPEERKYGTFTAKSQSQFITITQWETNDPVTTWTKASGVFVPVYPTIAHSLAIATVTLPATP